MVRGSFAWTCEENGFRKKVVVTFAIYYYKTFFPYVSDENSAMHLKRNYYTMYTVGKN